MGGRIYDAKLGRFLQADPLIQAPGNTQSYNRYSYTFNSPLSFIDPTGYSAENNSDAQDPPMEVVVTGKADGKTGTPGWSAQISFTLHISTTGFVQVSTGVADSNGHLNKAPVGQLRFAKQVIAALKGQQNATGKRQLEKLKGGAEKIATMLAGVQQWEAGQESKVVSLEAPGDGETVLYGPGTEVPKEADPEELAFMQKNADKFSGEVESCTNLCVTQDKRYVLATIVSAGSHVTCDLTQETSCPDGAQKVSMSHNHPAPGLYKFNAADIERAKQKNMDADFSKAKIIIGRPGLSFADINAAKDQKLNVWVVINSLNLLIYYDHNTQQNVHREYEIKPSPKY